MAKKSPQLNAAIHRQRRLRVFWIFAAVVGIIVLYLILQVASYRNCGGPGSNNIFSSLVPAMKQIPEYPFSFQITGPYTLDTILWLGIAYILAMTLLYLDDQRHMHDLAGNESGSAKWNNDLKGFLKKYGDKDPTKVTLLSKSVVMSMNTRKTQRNNNVLIVGASGAGKSRGFVKPNILQDNCNLVITDPSGELIESTGTFLERHDYTVKVFNLVQMDKSSCYNPFHYIRNEAGVMMMINCLIRNTTPSEQRGGDPFWEKSEILLLTALCFYLWQHRPVEEQNFGTVLKLLRMADVDEKNDSYESFLDRIFLKPRRPKITPVTKHVLDGEGLDPGVAAGSDSQFNEYVSKTRYVGADGVEKTNTRFLSLEELDVNGTDIAVNQYKAFKKGAGRTAKSILISCMVRLQAFNIPQIHHLTRIDSIHLEELGGINPNKKKQALFVIIPAADKTFNFLVAMMYSQLFETLYHQAETDPRCVKQRLPIHVKFLMDEFANQGELPDFKEKLATMRKYEISCSIILQSLTQIKTMYKDDWEGIIGNCDSLLFLGCKELTTTEYFSKLLGDQTITAKDRSTSDKGAKGGGASQNYKQTSRKLLNPDEIGNLPNQKCLVLVRGEDPFLDDKIVYTQHINYSETGDADSSLNYKILLNNAVIGDYDSEVRAQQLRSRKAREIKKVTLDELLQDNAEWVDYPKIYAKFKVVPISTSKVSSESSSASSTASSAHTSGGGTDTPVAKAKMNTLFSTKPPVAPERNDASSEEATVSDSEFKSTGYYADDVD